ncbi:MAG: DUF4330 domain-containing protein [Candidatus Melainabacteria bacterium]|nr:DUF4330 domain-containing protein [Candidatus Melainabacteria bacterium]
MFSVKARKVNLLNILISITIALCIIGYFLIQNKETSINKAIQSTEEIAIEVLIQDTHTNTNELFNTGDNTTLTVRHKPHKKLKILRIEERPKLLLGYDRTGSYSTAPKNISDYKDLIVTLQDTATVTKDGYVTGNIKVKIGNQIELEDFKYKLNGKIINIYPLKFIINGKAN